MWVGPGGPCPHRATDLVRRVVPKPQRPTFRWASGLSGEAGRWITAFYGERQRTAGRSTCAGLLSTRSPFEGIVWDHIGKTSTAFDNTAVRWSSSGTAAFVAASVRWTQSRSSSQQAVHRQVGRPLFGPHHGRNGGRSRHFGSRGTRSSSSASPFQRRPY